MHKVIMRGLRVEVGGRKHRTTNLLYSVPIRMTACNYHALVRL